MDKGPNWYTSLSTKNEENPPLEALIFACQKSEIINLSLALQVIMTAFIQRDRSSIRSYIILRINSTCMLTMSTQSFEIECKEIHDSWIPGGRNQLVRSLARRNRHERQQIRENYKAIYGDDLVKRLQQHQISTGISPNLCAALSLWMIDQHERDAILVREALDNDQQGGRDTNYNALVEIFASRKSSQILLIKQAYQKKFRRQLDQDIINIEPPHPHQKIVIALVASHKAHHADVNQDIAKSDARRLFETQSSSGIQEAVVLETLTKRSIPQLKLTFSCYKRIYGHDYAKVRTSVH